MIEIGQRVIVSMPPSRGREARRIIGVLKEIASVRRGRSQRCYVEAPACDPAQIEFFNVPLAWVSGADGETAPETCAAVGTNETARARSAGREAQGMTAKRAKMGADAGSKIFKRTAAEDLADVMGEGAAAERERQSSGEQERSGPDTKEAKVTTSYRLTQRHINWLRMEGAKRAASGGRADASSVLREMIDEAIRKQGSK